MLLNAVLFAVRSEIIPGVKTFVRGIPISGSCEDNEAYIERKLKEFLATLEIGTTVHVYTSYDNVDVEDVKKALLVKLIQSDRLNIAGVQDILVSIMNTVHPVTKRWLFDFDSRVENE